MAIFGGPTQTPYHPVGSSLYGNQNELIMWKPQWLTTDASDWWIASTPETFDTVRSRGLIFYDNRVGNSTRGLLAWVDELSSGKTDLCFSTPLNRAATITGLWKFSPTGTLPFVVETGRTQLVTNLNADLLDGFHAQKVACGSAITTAVDIIPVYKAGGTLSVGNPVDQCDAINLSFFQANQAGVSAKAPVQWATVSPLAVTVVSPTQLTATANGIFNPDPDVGFPVPVGNANEANAHRVLVKNQWTSGADAAAIPNGIYYLFDAGSGSSPYVLKRTSDADADGELARGNLVFVEHGGQNAGSQWQCSDVAPGGSVFYGPAITPGTEPNWWALFFRNSAYIQGKGIVIQGLTIHFAQAENYTVGALFTATGTSTVDEILPPGVGAPNYRKFLFHPGGSDILPSWTELSWDDIPDIPDDFPPGPHPHIPEDIKATVAGGHKKAVAYFTNPAAPTEGTLTGDPGLMWFESGVFGIGSVIGSGAGRFYYLSCPSNTPTDVLTFDTSTGLVGHRTVNSLLTDLWPSQEGLARKHTRWTEAGNLLEDSLLEDFPATGTATVIRPVTNGTDLGSAPREFGNFFAGSANLGALTLAVTAGTTPGYLLGIDTANTSRHVVKGYTAFPAAFITLDENAVGYGSNLSKLTGDAAKLYFDGVNFRILDGSTASPALAFLSDNGTGLYRPAALQLAIAINAVQRLTIGEGGAPGDGFGQINGHFFPSGAKTLGTTGNRWDSFYTAAPASVATAPGYVSGWDTDPSAGGTGVVLAKYTAAQLRAFVGLGVNGVGTANRLTRWSTAGTGIVDTTIVEETPDIYRVFATGLERSGIYLPGMVEHISDLFAQGAPISWGSPPPQLREGYASNVLANWETIAFAGIARTATISLTGVTEATANQWQNLYRPVETANNVNTPYRTFAGFTGNGTIVITFLGEVGAGATAGYFPYLIARTAGAKAAITSIKVEFRQGDQTTWVTGVDESGVGILWMKGLSTVWRGPRQVMANVAGKYLTGVRFTIGWNSATQYIAELGVAQLVYVPGNGVIGYLHQPNRWLQQQVFATWVRGTLVDGGGTNTTPIIGLGWDVANSRTRTGFYSNTYGQIDISADSTRMATWTNVGLGLGMFVPTALLELGPNTTTKAAFRFAPSGNALLTAPLSGVMESNNLRPYFTDSTPIRHPLAFYDDLTFTNDGNADMAGAVAFYGPAATTGATSNLDGQVIGTGDFSIWLRFRLPPVAPAAINGLFTLTNVTTGNSGGPHDVLGYLAVNQALVFVIRDVAGSSGAGAVTWTIPIATVAPSIGRICDIAMVRVSGIVSFYLNGVNVTPTPAGTTSVQAAPICNSSAVMRFWLGNYLNTVLPWQDRIYRAALFNRGLTQAAIIDLCRHGVNEPDKWGSTTELFRYSFASTTESFNAAGVGVTIAAVGGKLQNQFATSLGGTTKTTAFTLGKLYRVSFLHRLASGTAGLFQLRGSSTSTAFIPNTLYTPGATEALTTAEFRVGEVNSLYFNSTGAVNGALIEYDDIVGTQIGCMVLLDFGRVIGTSVYDWSGRYHAALTGTYEVVRPQFLSFTVIQGPGTITIGLRKYAEKISVWDDETKPIAHNFNLVATAPLTGYEMTVTAWDVLSKHQLTVGAVWLSANSVNVTFNKIGAPNTGAKKDVVVVVTA